MEEIAKILGKFFTRDLIYIVAGTSVITSFLYLYEIIPDKEFLNYETIFILAVGYIIGYVNQELFSIIRLITTNYPSKANKFCKWLYKRFTLNSFNDDILLSKPASYQNEIISELKPNSYDNFQRIITLKQIGTAIGSSCILCSINLGIHFFRTRTSFDLVLFITALLVGIVLIAIGWIKTLQQAEFIYNHKK